MFGFRAKVWTRSSQLKTKQLLLSCKFRHWKCYLVFTQRLWFTGPWIWDVSFEIRRTNLYYSWGHFVVSSLYSRQNSEKIPYSRPRPLPFTFLPNNVFNNLHSVDATGSLLYRRCSSWTAITEPRQYSNPHMPVMARGINGITHFINLLGATKVVAYALFVLKKSE